jgi:hypothetical protein
VAANFENETDGRRNGDCVCDALFFRIFFFYLEIPCGPGPESTEAYFVRYITPLTVNIILGDYGGSDLSCNLAVDFCPEKNNVEENSQFAR